MSQEQDFNYRALSEEKENLDFKNMAPCPHCKKDIPEEATMCYYCGSEVYRSGKPVWVVWVAVLLIIAFGLLMLLP